MGKYATIAYNSEHSEDLQKVCKSLNIKQREFIESSIQYFKQTGLDPREKTDFRSETNRLIGFLKTQDKHARTHYENLFRAITQGEDDQTNQKVMLALLDQMTTLLENQKELTKMIGEFIEK